MCARNECDSWTSHRSAGWFYTSTAFHHAYAIPSTKLCSSGCCSPTFALLTLLQLCAHPVPARIRVTGLVMTAIRGTSWRSRCWTILLAQTSRDVHSFQRLGTYLVGKSAGWYQNFSCFRWINTFILLSRPSICLIFFQVYSCSVRNCCKNVVAVDPRNRLSWFSFDGPGEFIVPMFFLNSSSQCARPDNSSRCSDENFISSQSHAQKNAIQERVLHVSSMMTRQFQRFVQDLLAELCNVSA